MNKDCYLANLCIIMEALFEIDLGPACKKAKLDKPISQEDNKENNYGNKSQGQYFYNRSQVGVSEKYFDWKRNCFICGQVCDTKHRSGCLYAIFINGCLATSGATVGERNKLELMTSQNI